MSDISTLSHDYEATSEFAQKVNDAVLSLKKALRRNQQKSRADLRDLADIVEAVKKQVVPEKSERSAEIPAEVVERLTAEHQSQIGYFVDDLTTAENALRGESPVDAEVIRVLDAICDAADASASAMFRRLRRR